MEPISSGVEHVGISLPFSSSSISNLLRVLGSGIAISCSREELLDLQITAEVMKISLKNCQIGHKKKSNIPLSSLSMPSKKSARHKRTHSKSVPNPNYQVENKVDNQEKNTLEENGDPPGDCEEEDEEKKKVSEFPCSQCEKCFKNKKHLSRHQTTHSGVVHSCSQCSSTFSRRDKLSSHVRKKHQTSGTDTEYSVETEVTTPQDLQPSHQEMVDFEELLNG